MTFFRGKMVLLEKVSQLHLSKSHYFYADFLNVFEGMNLEFQSETVEFAKRT
jgi:hypothetical protein